LDAACVSGRLITIEENARRGGFGEIVRDAIAEANLSGQIDHRIIALPDAFVEHGAQPIIRRECGLCAEALVEAVRASFKKLPQSK